MENQDDDFNDFIKKLNYRKKILIEMECVHNDKLLWKLQIGDLNEQIY